MFEEFLAKSNLAHGQKCIDWHLGRVWGQVMMRAGAGVWLLWSAGIATAVVAALARNAMPRLLRPATHS
ncbi:hypothetical protein ACLKA6_001742 [Drosophila palustris]